MTILSKPKFLRSPWLHWSNSSLLSRNLDWDWIWKSALSSLLRENICHIINNEGFQANPEYVHTIDEMKHPTMEKELQCFIRHLVWIQQFFDNPSTQTNLNRQVLHPDGPLYTNLTGSVNYLSGLKEWIRPLKNIKKCFSSPIYWTLHIDHWYQWHHMQSHPHARNQKWMKNDHSSHLILPANGT